MPIHLSTVTQLFLTKQPFPYNSKDNNQKFKELIIDHLEGASSKDIESKLEKICTADDEIYIDAKTLCNLVSVIREDGEAFDEDTVTILQHLTASTTIEDYVDATSNLYELLTRLQNLGHERLESLLDLINNHRIKKHWWEHVRKPALTMLGVFGFYCWAPDLFWLSIDWIIRVTPLLLHWAAQQIELHQLPILGMIGQISFMVYYYYSTFEFNDFNQSDKRFRSWFFSTLAALLTLMGHVISYLAAGTMPLLSVVIFSCATLIDIFESFYTAWYTPRRPEQAKDSIEKHKSANNTCYLRFKQRDSEIFTIKSVHAAVITGMLCTCYFLPSNAIISITYTFALWVGLFIKNHRINKIDEHHKKKLQSLLRSNHYKKPHIRDLIQTQRDDFNEYAQLLIEHECQNFSSELKQQCVSEKNHLLSQNSFFYSKAKDKFKYYLTTVAKTAHTIQGSTPSSILVSESPMNTDHFLNILSTSPLNTPPQHQKKFTN